MTWPGTPHVHRSRLAKAIVVLAVVLAVVAAASADASGDAVASPDASDPDSPDPDSPDPDSPDPDSPDPIPSPAPTRPPPPASVSLPQDESSPPADVLVEPAATELSETREPTEPPEPTESQGPTSSVVAAEPEPPDVESATPDPTLPVSAERASIIAEIGQEERGNSVSVLTNMFSADQVVDKPWAHYELGASVDVVDRIFVAQARMMFSIGMAIVSFASWMLDFVLRFDLGRMLVGDVETLVGRYAEMLNHGDGVALKEFVLTVAIAHAGWQIFRNRGQAAMAELLVALVIAATGGAMLTHPQTTVCSGLSAMGNLTNGMIALGSTSATELAEQDYCESDAALREAPQEIHGTTFDAFVHQPFLLLQWGEVPDPGSDCRAVAEALLTHRSWDNLDQPRDYMTQAGCEEMATFNAQMSGSRVATTGVYTLSAAAFAVAIVLSAGTLLVAQMAGALLVLAMPWALVVGIAPGTGRELLARWVHSVLKVAVLFMGSGFFLSLLTTSVGAVQSGTEDGPIVVRMLASVVVAWSLVLLRGRIFGSMRFAARSMTARAAGPGADIGRQGRGPGATAVSGTIRAAENAANLYAGTVAAKAGIGALRGGSHAATSAGPGASARGSRLARHHEAAGATPSSPPALPPPATRVIRSGLRHDRGGEAGDSP